jgi:hypothetical protein
VNDVTIICAGTEVASRRLCRAAIGMAIGDDFHPKGFAVLATHQGTEDLTPPVNLMQMATLDEVWFPCAGRDHHEVKASDIAERVRWARRKDRKDVEVTPSPPPD